MAWLHDAARNGNVVELIRLIGTGSDINERDKHSRAPIHLAAWAGHLDCVEALVSAKCNIGAGAVDDMNALHFAAQKGHLEICRFLLNQGLSVNAKTRKGMNALHFAAQGGHVDLVKHLLRRGKVDIVATNKGGRTALELAPDESTRQAIRAAIESAAAARSVDAMETEGPADGGEGSNPSDSKQKKRRAGSRKRPHAEAGGEEAEEEAAQPSASIGPSIGPSMLSIGPSGGPSMPSIGPSMPPGFVVDGSAPKDEDGQGKETERSPAIEPAIGTAGAQEGSDASLSRGAQLPVNDAKGQRQNGTQGTGSVPAVPPSSGSVAEGTRHPRKISRVALSHLDDDDDDVF